MHIDRRAFLLGGSLLPFQSTSHARGRVGPGGQVRLRLPWKVSVDPHRRDPASRLLAGNIFETLYRFGSRGIVPELAAALPVESGQGVEIPLREGLRLSTGEALTPKHVRVALERAAKGRGALSLEKLGPVRTTSSGIQLPRCSLRFDEIAPALSRMHAAIVVEGAGHLLGTGPFALGPLLPYAVGPKEGQALLRNVFARAGAPYLERIEIYENQEASESLRSFERKADDLGFGGLGLFGARKDAVLLPRISCGFLVLRPLQKPWDLPGIAQRVCNGLSPRLLSGHVSADWTEEPLVPWPGPSGDLIVRDGGPWFRAAAGLIAGALSSPGHVLTPRVLVDQAFGDEVAKRSAALALDWIDPESRSPKDVLVSLAALDSAARAREALAASAPKVASLRTLGQSTYAGLLGECSFQLGVASDVTHLEVGEGVLDFEIAHRTSFSSFTRD